jgi:hypothetical protein
VVSGNLSPVSAGIGVFGSADSPLMSPRIENMRPKDFYEMYNIPFERGLKPRIRERSPTPDFISGKFCRRKLRIL